MGYGLLSFLFTFAPSMLFVSLMHFFAHFFWFFFVYLLLVQYMLVHVQSINKHVSLDTSSVRKRSQFVI